MQETLGDHNVSECFWTIRRIWSHLFTIKENLTLPFYNILSIPAGWAVSHHQVSITQPFCYRGIKGSGSLHVIDELSVTYEEHI